MIGIKMIKKLLATIIVTLGIVFSGQVFAHGGLSLEDDLCVLTVGPYSIHFTGYQPKSQEKEFCEDIPEIGKTVVALDYVNEELRPFETEVRIVKSSVIGTPDDVKGMDVEDLDQMTVFHLPPEVYPNATIMVDHTFPEKGKFAGIVTVAHEDQEWVSVFPFSVGEGIPLNWKTDVLPFVLLAALAAFFFLRSRKKKQEEEAAA